MPTVIKRPDGRIEIRESVSTPKGPRSRTLAIARALTDDVLDHASSRASRPFDRDAVIERAARIGIHHSRPTQPDDVSSLAQRARSGTVWPTHARALRQMLDAGDDQPLPHHLEAMTEWMGVDDEELGRALVDVLKLSDAIMRHRASGVVEPLRYPSLTCPRR